MIYSLSSGEPLLLIAKQLFLYFIFIYFSYFCSKFKLTVPINAQVLKLT